MKIYQRRFEQIVPASLEEVWSFFSRPENLNALTPEDMNFQILTDLDGVDMYPGMMIAYKVSPFKGITMNWLTEITQVRDHTFFIDEQRNGPYRMWHHQHHFREVEEGIEMTDILHYAIPFGPIGRLANALIVAKRIDDIFAYRYSAVERIF
ncbi:MAG: SRPBCC family protein [Saprospiraceae bacterium]|nr:SRPBCC family protein [Saprospiraceae bacterium]